MTVLRLLIVSVAVALLGAPAAAVAHVQVTPGEAAPDDAVRFEVLVPNEDDKDTIEVDLQVPPGVLPFSYEDTPGWERELQTAGDGSVEVIRWTGRVEPEGFVRFSFLAATPPKPGTIAWKALQTYEGGEVVRWIGDEGSEYPAAFTEVSASASKTNAGGEGEGGGAKRPTAEPVVATSSSEESGRDGLTLGLAIAALLLGIVAVGLSVRRRA